MRWSGFHWPRMNRQRWIFALLLAFGVMCVISGYTSLSETDDELFHVSCGMQWWREHAYTIQPLHPPMARVMDASLLFLREAVFGPLPTAPAMKRDMYMERMVLTRLGTLPYYVFSCVLVFLWARRLFGEGPALWSLGAYVTLSSVTAHAGLATTDMGYTAMLLWAMYAWVLWMEEATMKRSLWLGVSLGLMVGTKFSGLLHWPLGVAAVMLAQMAGKRVFPLGREHFKYGAMIAAPCAVFVLWLVYLCDFAPLVAGIRSAARLDNLGYGVWFYGPFQKGGAWEFFPVVFFFKTPLALMAAACVGVGLCVKRVEALFPVLAGLVVMLSSMTSSINLGVRHVLPLYPLLAIVAGYGMWRLWRWHGWRRGVAMVLAFSQVIGFCMYHPEHLAYFNVAAGEHPERITLDSDFDWGQSMIMLGEELKKRRIYNYYLCVRKDAVWSADYVISAKMQACPTGPVAGWIAIGRAWRLLNPDYFTWLTKYEGVETIGKTMDLYYVAPKKETGKKPVAPVDAKKRPEAVKLPAILRKLDTRKPQMTPTPPVKPTLNIP